jgi:hypothetical protein
LCAIVGQIKSLISLMHGATMKTILQLFVITSLSAVAK